MKVIFDNNLPAPLARLLTGHEVSTCPILGWATLKNGALLSAAEEAGFDLMITADKNLRYQQNLASRRIALIVLGSNRWPIVRSDAAHISSCITQAEPGSYAFIDMPESRLK